MVIKSGVKFTTFVELNVALDMTLFVDMRLYANENPHRRVGKTLQRKSRINSMLFMWPTNLKMIYFFIIFDRCYIESI